MRLLAWLVVVGLVGCASLNVALDYSGNKPQSFPASVEPFKARELRVFRSAKHPGKLWVTFPPGAGMAAAFDDGSAQWAAMHDKLEPVYRSVALQALAIDPGGSCEIAGSTPWPQQFAIEYEFVCK